MSPLDWANNRRAFDGVTATFGIGSWKASGLWTRPVRVRKYRANDHRHSVEFYGVYAVGNVPHSKLGLDLYWLALEQDAPTPEDGTTGEVDRHTVGGRAYGKLFGTTATVDLEAAIQIGEIGRDSILAGMLSAELIVPVAQVAWSPEVFAGFDYASGGRGGGGRIHTFDQLFPLAHAFFGHIDAVGRQNVIAVHGGIIVSPIEKSVFTANIHSFWRADKDDALYNAGGRVVRRGGLSDSREVGVEVDLSAKYTVNPHLIALVGYNHLFAGSFIKDSGPGSDVDFGYAQLQYTF